ncbi:MAG TPA: 23S rRNA (adenine(2030)-N(6))-methyltransferase RlmJ [Roseomonas sp.]
MNYRHAFHAGNHADCLKHALLIALLRALSRKPAPFAVLDTHAGRGAYDLAAPEAARTGEALRGAARLAGVTEGPLADYAALLRQAGFPACYPGSPALVRALLRPGDRLLASELHPEDHAALRAHFARDPQVAVHRRDAYEAMGALTPFPEKRGLVLIDPPFEQDGEFDRLVEGIRRVNHRFRAGIVAAWYPVKHRAPLRGFHTALAESGVRDILDCALFLREPTDPQRLNGSGLIVVNPPFGFEAAARDILAALLDRLGDGEAGQGIAVTRIVEE